MDNSFVMQEFFFLPRVYTSMDFNKVLFILNKLNSDIYLEGLTSEAIQ